MYVWLVILDVLPVLYTNNIPILGILSCVALIQLPGMYGQRGPRDANAYRVLILDIPGTPVLAL